MGRREGALGLLDGARRLLSRLLLYCYKNMAYSFFTPKGGVFNITLEYGVVMMEMRRWRGVW
jgi:hypothetical protein